MIVVEGTGHVWYQYISGVMNRCDDWYYWHVWRDNVRRCDNHICLLSVQCDKSYRKYMTCVIIKVSGVVNRCDDWCRHVWKDYVRRCDTIICRHVWWGLWKVHNMRDNKGVMSCEQVWWLILTGTDYVRRCETIIRRNVWWELWKVHDMRDDNICVDCEQVWWLLFTCGNRLCEKVGWWLSSVKRVLPVKCDTITRREVCRYPQVVKTTGFCGLDHIVLRNA